MNSISIKTFDARALDLDILRKGIINEKRPVYTQGLDDMARNFRVTAALKKTTVGSEIATHMLKQIGAVVNLLCDPDVDDREKETRFADAMNYVEQAYVIYMEGQAHEKP